LRCFAKAVAVTESAKILGGDIDSLFAIDALRFSERKPDGVLAGIESALR